MRRGEEEGKGGEGEERKEEHLLLPLVLVRLARPLHLDEERPFVGGNVVAKDGAVLKGGGGEGGRGGGGRGEGEGTSP